MPVKNKVIKTGVEVPLYTISGEKKGTVFLPNIVFGQKPNLPLLAQAIRVYLSNQRSANAQTKGRGEINRTKRKVYRQKGTGNARHGAKSAPIFVGGGIAHGPRGERNFRLELTKNMRRQALISALSKKAGESAISVAKLDKIEPKTKVLAQFLKKVGTRGTVTFIHEGNPNLVRAGRNIDGVVLTPVKQLNSYQVLVGGSLILTEGALDAIQARK